MDCLGNAPMIFLFLLLASKAQAFPEFVRHGYSNCITCHFSPTGGGILTEYGRAMSKELLSRGQFFFEKKMELPQPQESEEEQFLGGAVKLPQGLSLGGDIRALQWVQDNKTATRGGFVFMQADLEAALSDGKRIVVDGTIGRAEPQGKAKYANDYLVSRRHWISVKMGPEETPDRYQLRFGRFYPAYGINIAEHPTVTRKQLGFDQQQETYNAELAYISETWNVFATYVAGRPDNSSRPQEVGGALQVSRAVGERYRLGVNAFQSSNAVRTRTLAGAFAHLGFSPTFYALTDFSWSKDRVNKSGLAEFFKLGWEFSRGVHLLATQQFGKPSFSQSENWQEAYSLGIQYYPRVHWDFLLSVGQERSTVASRDFDSVLLFLAHYYL